MLGEKTLANQPAIELSVSRHSVKAAERAGSALTSELVCHLKLTSTSKIVFR